MRFKKCKSSIGIVCHSQQQVCAAPSFAVLLVVCLIRKILFFRMALSGSFYISSANPCAVLRANKAWGLDFQAWEAVHVSGKVVGCNVVR